VKLRNAVVAVLLTATVASCDSNEQPPTSRPSPQASPSQSVAVRHAEWGQPVDVDGRYTITVSKPVDATDKFGCGGGSNCGRIGEMDVTVTAGRDDMSLSGAFQFKGVDDNFSEVGSTYVSQVGDVVLPAGKTHVEKAVQIHYGEAAKTNQLTLWVCDPAGVKLVEWKLTG
jgi:hypothetical protein